MLAISENAAEAIQTIVDSSPEVPGDAGLRITARAEGEQQKLELAIAAFPAEDDEVVEEHGAHVFLDPKAAWRCRWKSPCARRRVTTGAAEHRRSEEEGNHECTRVHTNESVDLEPYDADPSVTFPRVSAFG